ncbi:hypothetical protein PG991_006477 [Apiospora marii]|uniref:Uncharacterized protein n=1 Tax=Apiospora marii TaxID=335849 RepID=A0ABR1RZC5_9PEZI
MPFLVILPKPTLQPLENSPPFLDSTLPQRARAPPRKIPVPALAAADLNRGVALGAGAVGPLPGVVVHDAAQRVDEAPAVAVARRQRGRQRLLGEGEAPPAAVGRAPGRHDDELGRVDGWVVDPDEAGVGGEAAGHACRGGGLGRGLCSSVSQGLA